MMNSHTSRILTQAVQIILPTLLIWANFSDRGGTKQERKLQGETEGRMLKAASRTYMGHSDATTEGSSLFWQ